MVILIIPLYCVHTNVTFSAIRSLLYLQEDTGVCEQDIDGVAARDLLTTTLSRGKYLDSILNQHGGIRISPLILGWDRPGT